MTRAHSVVAQACRRAVTRAAVLAVVLLGTGAISFAQQPPLTGVIRAHDETIVQTETAGIVERILVKEGDEVAEGDPLVELRRERQEIALQAAKAGLASAEAQVEETRVLLDTAEKELARVRMAADALAQKEIDDSEDAVQRLTASLRVQTADLARAEQEVKLREHDVRETRLVAPFAGTVTRILVHRGDSLRPMETPVAELVNLQRLYVEVLLPRQEAQRLRAGRVVQVEVEREWLGRAGLVSGRVSYVNPTVNAASRMVTVKIDLPNPSGTVRPGMLANVRLE